MNSVPLISIVSPIYGRQLDLPTLCSRLKTVFSTLTENFEIILVNDKSPDNAWEVIRELARNDPRIKGINLSKNFGQHKAISAGLAYSKGEWIVVMDCDLQDQPEEIPKLYYKALEGFDVVVGRRVERRDSWTKRLTSRAFYIVFNYLTEQNLTNQVANFGIYGRKVIDAFNQFRDYDRSFGLLVIITGFRRVEIDIHHSDRSIGESAYSFRKRLNLALDIILSHSSKPLKLTVKFGFVVSLTALIYGLYLLTRYFFLSQIVSGWTSLIVTQLFFFGLTTVVLGIIGLYVGKIYEQVKGRPLYLIQETTF